MTNIRPTEKLPEYGDCLFALQSADEPCKGAKGEGALLESLHTGPLRPCYATTSSICSIKWCTAYMHTLPGQVFCTEHDKVYVCSRNIYTTNIYVE